MWRCSSCIVWCCMNLCWWRARCSAVYSFFTWCMFVFMLTPGWRFHGSSRDVRFLFVSCFAFLPVGLLVSFLLTGLCSSMLPVFMCEGIRCQLKSVYNYCCLIYQSAVMFTMFSDWFRNFVVPQTLVWGSLRSCVIFCVTAQRQHTTATSRVLGDRAVDWNWLILYKNYNLSDFLLEKETFCRLILFVVVRGFEETIRKWVLGNPGSTYWPLPLWQSPV